MKRQKISLTPVICFTLTLALCFSPMLLSRFGTDAPSEQVVAAPISADLTFPLPTFSDAIADTVQGFSSTQGLNNWNYGSIEQGAELSSSAFQPLRENKGDAWFDKSVGGVSITRIGMTAVSGTSAVRRFSPADLPSSPAISPELKTCSYRLVGYYEKKIRQGKWNNFGCLWRKRDLET